MRLAARRDFYVKVVGLLEDLGYTNSELASKFGISRQAPFYWRQGKNRPTALHLMSLSSEGGLPESEFRDLLESGHYDGDDAREALEFYRSRMEDFPHVYRQQIRTANRLLDAGRNVEGISEAERIVTSLQPLIEKPGNPGQQQVAKELLTKALDVSIRGNIEAFQRERLQTKTLSDINLTRIMADDLPENRGSRIKTIADCREVESYYVLAHCKAAYEDVLAKADAFLRKAVGAEELLKINRIQAVSLAQLGESRWLEEELHRIENVIHKQRTVVEAAGGVLHAREGRARCYYLLGQPVRAMRCLDDTVYEIPKLKRIPTFYESAEASYHYTRCLVIARYYDELVKNLEWRRSDLRNAVYQAVRFLSQHEYVRKLADITDALENSDYFDPSDPLVRHARRLLAQIELRL